MIFSETKGTYQQPPFSLICCCNYAFGKKQCGMLLLENESLLVMIVALFCRTNCLKDT